MMNIKNSIDQQIREKEIQMNTERGMKRGFHENLTDRFLSLEEEKKYLSNNYNNDIFEKFKERKYEDIHYTSVFNGSDFKASNIINKTKELLSSNKFSVPKKLSLHSNSIRKNEYSTTEETRKTYKNIKLSGGNFNSSNYVYLKEQILNNYSTNLNYPNTYNDKSSFIKTFNYNFQDVNTQSTSKIRKGFSEKFPSNDYEEICKNFSKLNNTKDIFEKIH